MPEAANAMVDPSGIIFARFSALNTGTGRVILILSSDDDGRWSSL
jgi:hypothetical protein